MGEASMVNRSTVAFAAAFAGGLLAGATADAAVVVQRGGFAYDCFVAAKAGRNTADGLRACSTAINSEPLSARDLAGTYVNRGLLYMTQRAYAKAERDFDQAIAVDPLIAEAYVNRGAALIGERRFAEGVAAITRGLNDGSQEPAKAYYNRAIGYEGLDNDQAAYADYVKAAQLDPGWLAPRRELQRFKTRAATPR
jgi:tetratricopeptide (TPR) repeat protein